MILYVRHHGIRKRALRPMIDGEYEHIMKRNANPCKGKEEG